ncbi:MULTISPECIES: hypothetical protein [unclassified Frankia]|uniref:hypothetical protein n=1 Tax=unclassified Frankia TaxID=2632575 RepID=UPI001EF71DD3|nr:MULTISPECIES: hypothetical protein [unclassified Frankia]
MGADISLDGPQEGWTTVDGAVLNVRTSDMILDAPARRTNPSGFRRALVHDQGDGLTINFNGDYPGGVTIQNAALNLKTLEQPSATAPALPRVATIGDLVLVHSETTLMGQKFHDDQCTLWLCVGQAPGHVARWQMLALGQTIVGTA